ncbi:MAG TPA: hypothetical protein VF155_01975 [Candidatus Dormibacteraeota bacterium]
MTSAASRSSWASVDPGHGTPIYLIGYSNGGRLAYTLACAAPTLVDVSRW